MVYFYRCCLLVFLCLLSVKGFSQERNNTPALGVIKGIAYDAAHNYRLEAASVAIYKTDSVLLLYQLTNNFGEFNFKNVPTDLPLKMVISYVGYKNLVRRMVLPGKEPVTDLGELNLQKDNNELAAVTVKYIPPVRMNKDTLEFNADAFDLDKNAVGEDLLRRLPGVTIWGDGTITVNGKPVNQVLVNGKPFFGGDTKVITQNIPKNAIDKVQVYKQNDNSRDDRDSVMDINIKLKKNKSYGYFGKLSAGKGTDDHYETDGNINFFNPKTQFGIVAAGNNVNKIAGSVNTLMRNSTFKGVGASIEYHPNLELNGTNQSNAAGIIFQHDFIPNPDYYKNNRLSGNYFLQHNQQHVDNYTRVITALAENDALTQQSNNRSSTRNTGQALDVHYDKLKNGKVFNLSAVLNWDQSNGSTVNENGTVNNAGVPISTNNITINNSNNNKSIELGAGIRQQKKESQQYSILNNLEVKYQLKYQDNSSGQNIRSEFKAVNNPMQDRYLDRIADLKSNRLKQDLYLGLDNLSRLLFGAASRKLPQLTFKNTLAVINEKSNSYVQNIDPLAGSYKRDNYLSADNRLTIINEIPTLEISRYFTKGFVNRYEHQWELKVNLQEQLYFQKNVSSQVFQNFTRDYQQFIPFATVRYSNKQYGFTEDVFALDFATIAGYPQLEQLYPLVDSSNQYYIRAGNAGLKEEMERKITLSYEHKNLTGRNELNYKLNLTGGVVDHVFTDSSHIDSLGRNFVYTANGSMKKYVSFTAEVNKAFRLNKHQLQFSFYPSLEFSKIPSNVNGVWFFSNSMRNTNSLNVYYSVNDWLSSNLGTVLEFYRSKQGKANGNNYRSASRSTSFSMSANITRRFTVSSNVTYKNITSTVAPATSFVIWNASSMYRLLPGQNLECKFAALDLLHQNMGVTNYGITNTLTYRVSNVLRQYFMFTVSYFPRKFGKRDKQ